ncbi:hypothetical protein ACFL1G_09485 [Planctomycetota bacterium]
MKTITFLVTCLFVVFCCAAEPTTDSEKTRPVSPPKQSEHGKDTKVAASSNTASENPKKPKAAGKTKGRKSKKRLSRISSLTPEVTFEEAIDIFRSSTEPQLNIVVIWKELERNANIYRHTPIGMEGISGIRLGTALKLLLASVSTDAAAELAFVVEDGIIIIATEHYLADKRMVTRIYDVSYLVSPPVLYFPLAPRWGGQLY